MKSQTEMKTAVCKQCGKTFKVTAGRRVGADEYCNAKCVDKMIRDYNRGLQNK